MLSTPDTTPATKAVAANAEPVYVNVSLFNALPWASTRVTVGLALAILNVAGLLLWAL